MAKQSFDNWERVCVCGRQGKPWWPRAALQVACGATISDIELDLNFGCFRADAIRIPHGEIDKDRDDPIFQEIVAAAKENRPELVARKIEGLTGKAFETLSAFANRAGPEIKDDVRLKAAMSILQAAKVIAKEESQSPTAKATAELVIRIERSERDNRAEGGRTLTVPIRLEDEPAAGSVLPALDGESASAD